MSKIKVASNQEWYQWGEIDPLYGVASWNNKQKGGTQAWTDDEFYRLGESDWQDFLEHWQLYGVNDQSCLEIGCGAGRITRHLSTYFHQTFAIDVSKGMIDYARKHVNGTSVEFYVCDGISIPLPDSSVSAVFSTHVFQHFDTLSIASNYFKEMSRTLISGGSIMIHLPIYIWPKHHRMHESIYQINQYLANIKASIRRYLMRMKLTRPIMRWLPYPITYFYQTLPALGLSDLKFMIFSVNSNHQPHSFLFARKIQ